ncbi:NAD(P)-dependent alcohol dehydrogenase [Peribacillus kribbensis]|uniref:NAD(P)-dependent alcohol dehydrogenase n=1 Tax=Peribacillus kribbensis TaxID=356658 RepID=UPI00040D149A|nr:NAD(P)-dependent alcohol dehydrogenase [Peribacillus kribbensis]
MKAAVCTKYGPPEVLELRDVKRPVPKDHEILVKVRASTVASGDIRVRSFNSPLLLWLPMRAFLGFTKPRKSILGVELAGEVAEMGKDVKKFKKGDHVFALTGMNFGGHAEYACISEKGAAAEKPVNMSFEEAAAAAFGGTSALFFLRKGKIQEGQRILIYGASGSVGTAAVQLARHFGTHITAVCSTSNFPLVKSLGAHELIDYKEEDFTETGERYDLIFDAVGKRSKKDCRKALASGGIFVTVNGQGIAKVRQEDLIFLKGLIETDRLISVIDKEYELDQITEAHRYVEKGHKKGNVVIKVRHGDSMDK